MNCRLFPNEEELVKAHIFPRWIFEDQKKGADHLKVLSSNSPRIKRSRSGIYDDGILSRAAENHLGPFDSYSAEFFRQELSLDYPDPNLPIQIIKDFDFIRLKTFIVSVLWRASISSREEFKLVNLGEKYDEMARNEILTPTNQIGPFPIMLSRFKPSQKMKNRERIFANPFPFRNENGVRFYQMQILDWEIKIKVDSQSITGIEDFVWLNPDTDLHLIVEDFDGSKNDEALDLIMDRMPKYSADFAQTRSPGRAP